jgi:divinyl protochlorophyllide a 8-vinyl-reductase
MRTRRASISALEFSQPVDAPAGLDRIGPNAVIQLIAALKALGESKAMSVLFEATGREAWLETPPQEMIAASEAASLHVGLRRVLPAPRAEAALAAAGRLTADYLLANRIPRLAQFFFRLLPARLAAWALMRTISAHAWTFAGSGVFSFSTGPVLRDVPAKGSWAEARILENPLCSGLRADAPACAWHAAVFEGLFRTLVSPSSRAREIACRAQGDDCCRFRLDWTGEGGTQNCRTEISKQGVLDGR